MNKLFFLFAIAGIFISCEQTYTEKISYQINEPVFMTSSEFRSSVKISEEPHTLSNYGKICFYDGYLYISEPEKGIHILDNRNPASPKMSGYIELLGNFDLAIRNGLLYADSYIDLVWFDISNPAQPQLKGRLEEAFPEALPVIENDYGYDDSLFYSEEGKKKGIVVGWKLKERTREYERSSSWWGKDGDMVMDTGYAGSSNSSKTGKNGSMSRFGLYQDYLYTVINNYMSIFNLSGETPVKAIENEYIGRNVETIFSYEDKMFMGTPSGLLIYSVEDPLKPTYCSEIWHVYGCDPVVVENDLAYVTIHSGNFCGQSNNELFIIDVSDVYHPNQLVSYTMKSPKGLGIDNETLFLCDDGLKAYKLGDPQTLMSNLLVHYQGMDGYDVIPFNNVLMMIADKGLYQYDYSNLDNIKELSFIPITK